MNAMRVTRQVRKVDGKRILPAVRLPKHDIDLLKQLEIMQLQMHKLMPQDCKWLTDDEIAHVLLEEM